MPVGPKNITGVRHSLIDDTIREIDEILVDPKRSIKAVIGETTDFYYTFVMAGVLNELEKNTLIDVYSTVGWGHVSVTNSHEVNQRPGMFYVKLYLKSDSRHLCI